MDVSKDYYRILGVSPSASLTDIRRAYRVQAVRWHPDMHVGESPEMIRIAEYRFKEVNEAYSILSDPAQRSNYDYFRAKKATAARPQPGAQSYSQSWAYSRAQTNAHSHAQSARSGIGDFWKTTLQGFAIAAAVLFYVVFPFSLVGGYWDTDAAARDISWKVGMEKQRVLMQSAEWKEVEIHAVDIQEIVLPKEYDESFGIKLKAQFMMEELKKSNGKTCSKVDLYGD